jgi:hypothetical protein
MKVKMHNEDKSFIRRHTMQENKKLVDFTELEKALPPIVFRNWPNWRQVLPISPRTLANEDSLGTGPHEKIMVGRVVGYPRAALIEWLRERSRVIR